MGLYLLDNSCNISFYKLHERTRLDYISLDRPKPLPLIFEDDQ
jgi:hypothetical protein